MSNELWTPALACAWFKHRNEEAVYSLPKRCTFAMLAFYNELEASNVNRPGSGWIKIAQEELLAACRYGQLEMTGCKVKAKSRTSRTIPKDGFATFQFFEYQEEEEQDERRKWAGPPVLPVGRRPTRDEIAEYNALAEQDARDERGKRGADNIGPHPFNNDDCWMDLSLKADDVRRVWPAVPAAAIDATPTHTLAQTEPAAPLPGASQADDTVTPVQQSARRRSKERAFADFIVKTGHLDSTTPAQYLRSEFKKETGMEIGRETARRAEQKARAEQKSARSK